MAPMTNASVAAAAASLLLAINLPPSATFLNQAAACVAWGGLSAFLLADASQPRTGDGGQKWLAAALTALMVLVLASATWRALPAPLGLSAVAAIAVALLVSRGAAFLASTQLRPGFRLLATALLTAGAVSVVFAQIQYFAPQWADGTWIAASTGPRVAANLRQPNHLGTLLLWSIVCLMWWWPRLTGAKRTGALLGFGLLVACIVQTGSRTAALGVLVLAAWGLLDKRLPRSARLALIAGPAVYALFWFALDAFAQTTGQAFAGEGRFIPRENFSSNRFAIWSNTWELIKANPWFGVGWGNFNFAWTLTPFPDRPPEFFDHTHNLFLQFAVELGLPLAAAVSGLLCFAFWRAFRASQQASGEEAHTLRAAFMLVLMVGIHSQFEYPLWYAYFLLPTAFAFGLCLGAPAAADLDTGAIAVTPRAKRWRIALITASLAMSIGGVLSVFDYLRVSVIFAPRDDASSLAQRIEAGKRSVLFAHHAHYAAATTAEHPSQAMDSFRIASHYLLDTRLMVAWAKAYAELGDLDRARHIAARLREFNHPDAQPFFAPCERMFTPEETVPFQCAAPTKALTYRDFL